MRGTTIENRRSKVAIIGLGTSEFSRSSRTSARALAAEACINAISDAGMTKKDIDGLLLNRSPLEPHEILPLALRLDMGLGDLSLLASIEGEGSSALQMIQYASYAISSGAAKAVLCVFADAPVGDSGAGNSYAVSLGLTGLEGWDERQGLIGATGGFALSAQRYFHLYGGGPDSLYSAAASDRRWAEKNPDAFLRKPLTKEEYLASRWIVEPLRLFDCAYPVNGAVAVVVTSASYAEEWEGTPMYIHGFGQGHGGSPNFSGYEPEVKTGAEVAARNLYAATGLSPQNFDFCEFYNAFSITTLLALEGYGFCGAGEAVDFISDGITAPGGALPTNTGGGHLSSYYLQGMTPIHEAVVQIRGDGGDRQLAVSDIGLVTGFGGRMEFHAAMAVSQHREL